MNTRYCYGCMKPIQTDDHMCGTCGFDASAYKAEPHHLQPGTVLHDRYLVGRVIGEGGFGITYVGRDTLLDRKVAVKEFYMKGFVNRNSTASLDVSVSSGTDAELFERNREKFLDEARVLARFDREAGIVRIQDFFEENNTAYMVMEFLEGKTLRDHLKETGTIPAQQVISLMWPLMHSLERVHQQNIIHRDISPDNIMVLSDGRVQLLDFGAAREVSKNDVRSLSVILKPGYAPEEQYRTRGKQGPWTDVYALCATMYRCISGTVPDESMERMFEDKLQPLSRVSSCPESVSSVIMKGLSLRQEGRYQSVDLLQKDLEKALKEPAFRTGPPAGHSGNRPPAQNRPAPQTVKTAPQIRADAKSRTTYSVPSGRPVNQQHPKAAVQSPSGQTAAAYPQRTAAQRPAAQNPSAIRSVPVQPAAKPQVQPQKKAPISKKRKTKRILMAAGIPAAAIATMTALVFAGLAIIESIDTKAAQKAANEAERKAAVFRDETVSRLSRAQAGDIVWFGNYEQDNNSDNGKEPINWIVLEKEEDRLLVISKDVLDATNLDIGDYEETWGSSDLRVWMNGTFYDEAFSDEEKTMIPFTTLIGEENPYLGEGSAENTDDRVFPLSMTEAEEYFASDEARRSAPSEYCAAKPRYSYQYSGCWWLRTPSTESKAFAAVDGSGAISAVGFANNAFMGVRPAMWIYLGSADELNEKPVAEPSSAQVGDVILFGRFEQDDRRLNGKEDIEWIVLAREDDRLLLISKYVLDCRQFDTEKNATWETSSLRNWLNGRFLNRAFNTEEKVMILNLPVSADVEPWNETDPGNETTDRIFLFSTLEVGQYYGDSVGRQGIPTACADDQEKTEWWLRTPGEDDRFACYIDHRGMINVTGDFIRNKNGVRPVMWIDLD